MGKRRGFACKDIETRVNARFHVAEMCTSDNVVRVRKSRRGGREVLSNFKALLQDIRMVGEDDDPFVFRGLGGSCG